MADPTPCDYCHEPATDWCPACLRPLCDDHGSRHQGRLDGGCEQSFVNDGRAT